MHEPVLFVAPKLVKRKDILIFIVVLSWILHNSTSNKFDYLFILEKVSN